MRSLLDRQKEKFVWRVDGSVPVAPSWFWVGLVRGMGRAKHGRLPDAPVLEPLWHCCCSPCCVISPPASSLLPKVGTQLHPAPYPVWDKFNLPAVLMGFKLDLHQGKRLMWLHCAKTPYFWMSLLPAAKASAIAAIWDYWCIGDINVSSLRAGLMPAI